MGDVYVEFFSDEALENIMTMLRYHPERIIYLGHKHNMITKKMKSLRKFASVTSPETVLEFIEVPRDSLDLCIQPIDDICEEYPEAHFELTGGGEMFLIAFGYVSAKRKTNTLRIDPYTGTEMDFNNGDAPVTTQTGIKISVSENIILHGGVLRAPMTNWRFTEQFRDEIRTIWGVAQELRHNWNKHCSVIEEVVKNYPADENGVYRIPKAALRDAVQILQRLSEVSMMDFFRYERSQVIFRFRSKQIREIVTKTGNILELHVYEVVGAVIDWDGEAVPEPNPEDGRPKSETINEIDVILMRSAVPTFISCKSGRADSKALHELETVTSRFGGKYAKKVLVMASPCDTSTSGSSFFKQRAKDMHIWVLDDIYSLTDEQLIRKLQRIQGA